MSTCCWCYSSVMLLLRQQVLPLYCCTHEAAPVLACCNKSAVEGALLVCCFPSLVGLLHGPSAASTL
jgi:hypothetical protein